MGFSLSRTLFVGLSLSVLYGIGVIDAPLTHASILIERLEASANSALILKSDVEKFRKTVRLRTQLDPLFTDTPLAQRGEKASESEIVDFLVDEKIIFQMFPVTDAEVEQEISSIQANNQIDRDQLRSALKEQGFTFEEYYELIRIGTSKRNLIDREIRSRVTISDDDIKNYFYNHYSKRTGVPMTYRIKIVSLSPTSYKSPSDLRRVAEAAYQSVKSGEPFEEVAKRVSDDPSAAQGGDFGFVDESQMAPIIRSAVTALQLGQVSPLIGDQKSGFFIIKLVDKKSGEDDYYQKMKEEIRANLSTKEYQAQINLWLAKQRQSASIHKAAFSGD